MMTRMIATGRGLPWDEAEFRPAMRLNLHFFDDGGGEKTEKATPRKRNKAREEGQVAKSQEIGTAFLLLAAFFSLKYFASRMLRGMMAVFNYNFSLIGYIDTVFELDFIARLVAYMFGQVLLIAMPLLLVALVLGLLTNVIQVGWHPTTKPLMPKLSKLNPIKGVKRLFSMRALLDLVKALVKFGIILYVIYSAIKSDIDKIPALMELTVMESVMFIGGLMVKMGLNVGMIFIFVAIADYSYQRYKHNKDLKMSKHEVKEEYKQMEGDPHVRGKIKQKMREVSMRRMMAQVPQADVIITNPKHYAVALQYDKDNYQAPVVVAKGVDYLARRIREKGAESGVEIVENVQLARALYATVDIGREIPEELYQAVAEVLAFVYKLKNKVG